MGRPIKKVNFGTAAGANAGIIITAFVPDGSSAVTGYIVKQVGSKTYKVTTAQGTGRCRLVETISAAGQMTMVGFDGVDTVKIRKLTQHVAIDFSGNRYSWALMNDSSADYIELTPIA
jgi:hypothetical protein